MATANVNPELLRERKRCSFPVDKLTNILDGGDWFTERRRYCEKLVYEDKGYDGPNVLFLSRDEAYSEGVRKAMYMTKRIGELGLQDATDLYWYRASVFPNQANPLSLNTSMFIPTLTGQATEEQQGKWLEKAKRGEIVGTYAQTEMGHGTFLRGLETTANYDMEREEFVLHSPTLTSIKWWPGGLGKTSNFAVVMANLVINERSHGVQAFIVQLRDLDTHRCLPGITLGDIGPKFGYEMIDNGFLRLDHVRIPRSHMLMKNAQVLRDGTFVKASHAKLSYGTMVFVRAMIAWDVAAKSLAQAVTIAIRYSCVRHQSELKPGGPEPQVLEYQSQQAKLFPQLAAAYAFWFAGLQMRDTYFMTQAEIQEGNVELLPELHALSSGLKAHVSYLGSAGIEVCRMACGGHGYSAASGIPSLYTYAVPACTYEGENNVMYLQAARYLMKCFQARHNSTLPDTVKFLQETDSASCQLDSHFRPEALAAAFRHRARRMVAKAAEHLQRLTSQGKEYHDAWNGSAVHLMKASQAYVEVYILQNFIEKMSSVDDPAAFHVLTKLCQLYAINCIISSAGDFVIDGYMTRTQMEACEEKVLSLFTELRPEALSLVDAFDFPDRMLNSVLGRYDGNVYENLYKWAAESPLNANEVHASFEKYMKPNRVSSKL